MRRRTVLAAGGVSISGALAGCSTLTRARVAVTDPRWFLRAMHTTKDAADNHCTLGGDFVAAHPKLESVLTDAADRPVGDWSAKVYLDKAGGVHLGTDLVNYCEGGFRGVYGYDGDWFFVDLRDRHPERGDPDAHHGNNTTA